MRAHEVKGAPLEEIFGELDAMKFQSSMQLFGGAGLIDRTYQWARKLAQKASRSPPHHVMAALEAAIHSHTMRGPFFIYIMANKRNGTIYVGVTNNLARRVFEYREGLTKGFTSRYGLKTLVYYEIFESISDALQRETSLKR